MNSTTDRAEQTKDAVVGYLWDDGREMDEGMLLNALEHKGFSEIELESAIGELLDEWEIFPSMIKTDYGWRAALRRLHPVAEEQKRQEAAEKAQAYRVGGAGRCKAYEAELAIDRMRRM